MYEEEREKVIEVAKTWLKTPYVPEARVKHGGCDCGTFLAEVFEEAGMIGHVPIEHYPVDIACNCATPKYLMKILEYTVRVHREPITGDIIVYQFGGSLVPHHAALCIDSEYIIHSYTNHGVTISNRRGYKKFEYGIYSLKRWEKGD